MSCPFVFAQSLRNILRDDPAHFHKCMNRRVVVGWTDWTSVAALLFILSFLPLSWPFQATPAAATLTNPPFASKTLPFSVGNSSSGMGLSSGGTHSRLAVVSGTIGSALVSRSLPPPPLALPPPPPPLPATCIRPPPSTGTSWKQTLRITPPTNRHRSTPRPRDRQLAWEKRRRLPPLPPFAAPNRRIIFILFRVAQTLIVSFVRCPVLCRPSRRDSGRYSGACASSLNCKNTHSGEERRG